MIRTEGGARRPSRRLVMLAIRCSLDGYLVYERTGLCLFQIVWHTRYKDNHYGRVRYLFRLPDCVNCARTIISALCAHLILNSPTFLSQMVHAKGLARKRALGTRRQHDRPGHIWSPGQRDRPSLVLSEGIVTSRKVVAHRGPLVTRRNPSRHGARKTSRRPKEENGIGSGSGSGKAPPPPSPACEKRSALDLQKTANV
ncbi:hypothetical protein PBRA_003828 [Plasmodiophora brassicae]|uniref:Uncharacterized protein n=1 Tax=Plasmodiophora brassicae TaxID=37360 RepID=A0A0G4IIR5_PLABS|nr:hypothetical protein PBRA_003828 [Plasmodiophora brassicae]